MLTFDEYQGAAARTAGSPTAGSALGLAGEAGEVADLLKKHLFHGHELSKEKLADELGDVLWYVADLASRFYLSLGDIAAGNVEKLRRRYPAGFSAERSRSREGA